MLTLPRFGVLVAMNAGLAFVVALWLIPDHRFWSRVAPERYLAGADVFDGPERTPEDADAGLTLPAQIIAWRRLAHAHDTAAFVRLMTSAAPAGRLYGLAGMRLLAPARADAGAQRLLQVADSVSVYSGCVEGRMPLARAVRELDVGGWADSLLTASVRVRDACALTNR
jgi:hypothetical protein